MSFTDFLEAKILDHLLKTATWSAPTNLYVGLHIATDLDAGASSGASSIDVTDEVTEGSRLILNPGGGNEETIYAGTVTGAGPYTVQVEDSAGSGATLANTHTGGESVKFDPADDGSDLLEPGAGSYARVQHNSWNAAADAADADGNSQGTNNGSTAFAQATGDAWGLATHFFLADASSGGNILCVGELDSVQDVVLNATLTFPSASIKIKLS